MADPNHLVPNAKTPRGFVCSHPRCGKSFLRKEHRNRHFRTHGSSRPHKCYICNRGFARSDILNRHVLQHNIPPEGVKRTLLACQSCRKRKTKCDSDDPCSNCSSSNRPCIRQDSSMQASRRSIAEGVGQPEEEEEEEGNTNSSDNEGEEDISDQDELENGEEWEDNTATNKNASGGDFDAGHGTSVSDFAQVAQGDSDFAPSSASYMSVADSGYGTQNAFNARNSSTTTLNSVAQSTHPMDDYQLALPEDQGHQPSANTHMLTVDTSFPVDGCDFDTSGLPPATDFPKPDYTATHLQYQGHPNGTFDIANLENSPSFTRFHRDWPILHMPTFSIDNCTAVLSLALINVSGWLQDTSRHHLIPHGINEMFIKSLMPRVTGDIQTRSDISKVSLQNLQALVITICYAVLSDSPQVTINWAVQWCDIAISKFRQLGILANCWTPADSDHYEVDRWLVEDQVKRLVYVVLRLDAYLSIMTGRPPILRFQEIRIPLPVSEDLWNEPSHESRLRLHWTQPAGRAKLNFNNLMRQGLLSIGPMKLPLQLSLEDYHFGLCALQSELWTVTQETRYHDHRTYKNPSISSYEEVRVWYNYLLEWRNHVEQNHHLENNFFAMDAVNPPGESFNHSNAALNLTLYHISAINLFANVHLLETTKCCPECTEADISHRIQAWTQTPSGRHAVLHAAQIQRVHECEYAKSSSLGSNARIVTNVLSPTGLLMSAVVICMYGIRSSGCSSCSTTHPIDDETVELAGSGAESSGACQYWVENGGSASVNGLPLCLCSVPKLSKWYCDRLKGSPAHEQRLIRFLLGLKA